MQKFIESMLGMTQKIILVIIEDAMKTKTLGYKKLSSMQLTLSITMKKILDLIYMPLRIIHCLVCQGL
jgi:hypothetical protein